MNQASKVVPPVSQAATDYDNPYPLLKQLRESTPVFEGDFLTRFKLPSQAGYLDGRPTYTLTRYHDVMAVLRDPAVFTSGLIMEGLGAALGDDVITGMDGAPHKHLRSLLAPCFGRDVIDYWADHMIRPVIRAEFVAPLAASGKGSAELMSAMGSFPMRVVYEVLGFPNDPEAISRFAEWGMRIKEAMAPDPGDEPLRAAHRLYDQVLPLVAQRRAVGSEGMDLIGQLLRTNYQGHSLNDDEITRLVRMLITAAVETTTLSFANMMVLLLERPEVIERVRVDRGLILKAVDETMRYETPASFLARQAKRAVEFGGVAIPEGAALSLAAGAANRDETVFENGESFRLDRPAKPHIGFGFGPHMCIGQHVARVELASALEAILDGLPNIRFDPDQPAAQIRGVIKRNPGPIHVVWG